MPFIPFGRTVTTAAMGLAICAAAHAQDTDCAAPDSYTPPADGTIFRFEILQGEDSALNVQILHRIGESDGAETIWQREYVSTMADLGNAVNRFPPDDVRSVAGLFETSSEPTQQEDGFRRYRFGDDLLPILLSLEPGDTATTTRAETSAMHNRTRTIRGPFVVTFEGCGTVDVAGEDHPVRFYRLESDSRSYRPGRQPEADMVVTTVRTVALSMEYGWPVEVATDENRTHVIEITSPDTSGDTAGE